MLRYNGLFCADNENRHLINSYDYNHNMLNSKRFDYIVPRELCGTYRKRWFIESRDIKDMPSFIMVPFRYLESLESKSENECFDCPYSEDCNGQMCFFSMV